MSILIDSNVLLRSLHPRHPHYPIALNAIAALRRRIEPLCLAPQNLIEFWAVATRSLDENGLGMTHTHAAAEIEKLRRFFRLLPSTPDVLDAWQRLVLTLEITGKQTHDAHLAAVMEVYSVTSILTFNTTHFGRFPGIAVIDPDSVI